jgi:hypothetical protein
VARGRQLRPASLNQVARPQSLSQSEQMRFVKSTAQPPGRERINQWFDRRDLFDGMKIGTRRIAAQS